MAKKVSFDKPARPKPANLDIDTWVASGNADATDPPAAKSRKTKKEEVILPEPEETTRFTIDIPTDLHARIKAQCAIKKVKMKVEIQALLEKHFA
jgi:hypothetical protein